MSDNTVKVIRTSQDGEYVKELPNLELVDMKNPTGYVLRVFPGNQRQEMVGIGGAITESAAYVINMLSPEQQQDIYDAYFSNGGCNYSIIRTHIGSCDFSLKSYSYDDMTSGQTDSSLNNFSISNDMVFLIPAIKRVLSCKPGLKVLSSPWSPPAWMKQIELRTGNICNWLKHEYYDSYANYLVKYILKYKEQGIDVWAITMQNETQNDAHWESCTWSIDDTKNFIKLLGPKLSELNVKLFVWDWDKGNDPFHRDGFTGYNVNVLSDNESIEHIYGVAFHWYAGDLAHEIAGVPMWSIDFNHLDDVKNKFSSIHLLATEGCQEKGPWLGDWGVAFRYVYDMINDFEHGTEGWVDWNIVLDSEGGPNQAKNFCHAPIMVNTQTRNIIYNPSYYMLKQFSQYIQPGCVNIKTDYNGPPPVYEYTVDRANPTCVTGIFTTAFRTQDGNIIVFIGNYKGSDQEITIVDGYKGFKTTIKNNSLATFIYKMTSTEESIEIPRSIFGASGYEHWGDLRPEKAIDNDFNTRWGSEWQDNEWIAFDMGDMRNITGVKIYWENGNDASYDIQVSSDANNWTTVFTAQLDQFKDKITEIRFSPQMARYVKLQGVKRKQWGYSIFEFRVITLSS